MVCSGLFVPIEHLSRLIHGLIQIVSPGLFVARDDGRHIDPPPLALERYSQKERPDMDPTYERYKDLDLDGSLICLARREAKRYLPTSVIH